MDIVNVQNKFIFNFVIYKENLPTTETGRKNILQHNRIGACVAINIDHIAPHNRFHQQFSAVNFHQWFGIQKSQQVVQHRSQENQRHHLV